MTTSFIETQFPIARLSAESYKERKANNGQTLTRLGKWWGRKPLILARAVIVGMLMPVSSDAKRDRDVFLKILTMDDAGTLARWRHDKRFTESELREFATSGEAEEWNRLLELQGDAREQRDSTRGDSRNAAQAQYDRASAVLAAFVEKLQARLFQSLSYTDRIARCERPENTDGPSDEAWADINAHLKTSANNLSELVEQLGQRRFGHRPRVGDCFCGGGSIPFEAARIGCEAFGSDLNPVAGLLTWASLNLIGGGAAVQEEVQRVQQQAFEAADRQITEWGIEHNDQDERADAYLYCIEVKPEGCDYYIPLAPTWGVGEKSLVVVDWHRPPDAEHLEPTVRKVPSAEFAKYKAGKGATAVDSRVIDPLNPDRSWSMESLRGPAGLRRWTNDDVGPGPGDVFQERLYCVRWAKKVRGRNGKEKIVRRYAAPEAADLAREVKVLALLRERFAEWQRKGFIPSAAIKSGAETDRLPRERGWTHWHHLFTPRQLLTIGLVSERSSTVATSAVATVGCMLGIGRMADWNSRLSAWMFHKGNEKGNQVFYNQALNPHANYAARPVEKLRETFPVVADSPTPFAMGPSDTCVVDARDLDEARDLWVTDPPYADAVNYHELADFFLAWYEHKLHELFPSWSPDSRAELAVRGDGDDFRHAMVDIYRNLARHMPDDGLQMVMFTHKDPAVWAGLGMILWAAGLKATAAWTIATETEASGIKKGNYVQGTVCLVLRKRMGNEAGFLDEIFPMVEDEVHRQIDAMRALDEGGEPNFNDADYQLAAYAAALKVLTQYGNIDGRDVEHEVFAVRGRDDVSAFQRVIERAVTIACDYLIPRGLDAVWRDLDLPERYYLRALDIESRGERRKGMYEELARGFNLTDIKPLLFSDKANGARMLTADEFGEKTLAIAGDDGSATLITRRGRAAAGGPHPFAVSALRHLLFAIRETTRNEDNPEPGRQYLRDTFGQGYWALRERFVHLLDWLSALGNAEAMDAWAEDSAAARVLTGRLRNDHA